MGHGVDDARRAIGIARAATRANVRADSAERLGPTVGDLLDVPVEALSARLTASRRVENLEMFERLRVVAALRHRWTPDEVERRADRLAGRRDTSAESLTDACVVAAVAGALGLSETAAGQRLDAAVALLVDRRLPIAARLCADGDLDWARLHALVTRTRDLTPERAHAVEGKVLNRVVRELTIGRFMTAVDRAVLAVDATAAQKRRTAVGDGRRVSFWKDGDGRDAASCAAGLHASGPADALAAAYASIDAAARRLRDQGDPRTLDQLRHDLLVDACTTGALPVPQDALPERPRAAGGEQPDPQAAVVVAPRPPVPAQIVVTVSRETLLGLNDEPADLAGYGPITAQLARDLAADGIWRCAAVDDTHGTVLGVGRATWTPGYSPGKALRDFLAVAAPPCSVPWCNTPAARCDIDHHTPYAAGGSTCSCNTGPACRRHHRQKSAGYITVRPSTDPAHPPGTHLWTFRDGRSVVVRPYAPLPPEAYRSGGPPAGPAPDDAHPGPGDASGACTPDETAPPF